jgi:hypothetical protein
VNTTIELNFYCTVCGNELDTEFNMCPKSYNHARVDVTPCKTCERIEITGAVSLNERCTVLPVKEKKPKRVKKVASAITTPKKRGRPRIHPLPDQAPAKRGPGHPRKNPLPLSSAP